MTREVKLHKTFFEIFVFTQVVCFSPTPKFLVIFMPIIAIVWFLKRNPLKKSFKKAVLSGIVILMYPCLYFILKWGDFFISNFILGVLFYSSFLFFFISKSPEKVNKEYIDNKFVPFIKWMIIIQATTGVLQIIFANNGLDLSSGDLVQGTINIFSFLNHENGFSNVFFVINLTCLLCVYIFLTKKKSYRTIVLGFTSIILASTIHLSLAFIIAALGTYFCLNIIKALKISIPILLFFITLAFFFPSNFASISGYKKDIVESKNLKVVSTKYTLNNLMLNPINLLFGYGIGQYSSRSALVASGNYFYDSETETFKNPLGLNNETDDFKKNLKENWIASISDEQYGFSVMNKPVYSLLSVFSETGMLVFLILSTIFLLNIRRFIIRYKEANTSYQKRLPIVLMMLSFFLLAIGLFENYFEMAQAIFPMTILIKFLSNSKLVEKNEELAF